MPSDKKGLTASEMTGMMETLKELGFSQFRLETNGVFTAIASYRTGKGKDVQMLKRVSDVLPGAEIVESYESRGFWPWKTSFVLSIRTHEGVSEPAEETE